MDALEQAYYEWDGFWDNEPFATGENAIRIQRTVALVPSDVRSVVDIGSGTGEFGRQLAQARSDVAVMAIDRSEAALRRVSSEKALGSVDAIPLPARAKDLVSCLQVIEHLPVPIYQTALDELARVARRYLLVSVPFEEVLSAHHTRCPACGSIFNANLHLRSYGIADVSDLFSNRGFRYVRSEFAGGSTVKLGIATYGKLRRLAQMDKPSFASPLCPICGYSRTPAPASQAAPTSSQDRSVASKVSRGAKDLVLSMLPSRPTPPYWIIALYERNG